MTSIVRLSESYPPDSTQNQVFLASVHKTLEASLASPFKLENLSFRPVKSRKELEEIQLLHKEWFPINYSQSYFESIFQKKAECVISEYKVIKSNRISEKVIVGCILYEVRAVTSKYMDLSVRDYFKELKSIYIMTIGVINEYRKNGIASLLVKTAIEKTQERFKNSLKYIYLHVVEYNNAAQRFYEKNGFICVKIKKKHYTIEGKDYSAKVYVLYFNGARRPFTKLELLGLFFDKINIFKHCFHCLQWVCARVFKRSTNYRTLSF